MPSTFLTFQKLTELTFHALFLLYISKGKEPGESFERNSRMERYKKNFAEYRIRSILYGKIKLFF